MVFSNPPFYAPTLCHEFCCQEMSSLLPGMSLFKLTLDSTPFARAGSINRDAVHIGCCQSARTLQNSGYAKLGLLKRASGTISLPPLQESFGPENPKKDGTKVEERLRKLKKRLFLTRFGPYFDFFSTFLTPAPGPLFRNPF